MAAFEKIYSIELQAYKKSARKKPEAGQADKVVELFKETKFAIDRWIGKILLSNKKKDLYALYEKVEKIEKDGNRNDVISLVARSIRILCCIWTSCPPALAERTIKKCDDLYK